MTDTLAAQLEVAGLAPEELVERAYRLLLRRQVDPESRAATLERLAAGTLSAATLLHELATSVEFARVRELDDAVARARGARSQEKRPRWLQGDPSTDERAVEIAWTLARYRREPHVLDVGYAFAEPVYLAALTALGAERLVGVDLAEIEVPGLEGVVADVRELPFPAGSFELALCISTLEHIGRDTRLYGQREEHDPQGLLRALRELRRVLTRRGRLLLTVPCGEEQELGWLVQLPAARWRRLFCRAGLYLYEEELYELTSQGWRANPALDERGVRYGERGPGASAILCAELRPGLARQLLEPQALRYAFRRRSGRLLRRLRR